MGFLGYFLKENLLQLIHLNKCSAIDETQIKTAWNTKLAQFPYNHIPIEKQSRRSSVVRLFLSFIQVLFA